MSIVKPPSSTRGRFYRGNHRGVAILVAIGVVAVMLTAGLEFNRRIRGTVTGAIHSAERLVRTEMAASGVHAAMVMLINDRKESQTVTIQEDWADPEKVAEMMDLLTFSDGSVDVSIIDERSKIQVNALVKFPEGMQFSAVQRFLWERLLDRVFSVLEHEVDSDPNMIINSLKDWLDDGDDDAITGLSGAESDYYQSLDPPYSAKNGPMDHLGELALVRGVTPELFSGAGGAVGLSSLLTVYGESPTADGRFTFDGRINISTADIAVLAALLPSEHADLAEALADYRTARADETYINDITRVQWYKNVPGAGDITINPDLITVSSDLFRIVSTATRSSGSTTINAVVQREQEPNTGRWICKTLSWHEE